MIWVVFAVLTGVAVLAFLWPLAGKPRALARREVETGLYRAEVAGIDRDVERGLMTPADAETAKAEAARRLLAATAEETGAKSARRGVRFAAILVILFVPLATLGLYFRLGAPDYPDRPLQARLTAPPGQMDIEAAVARVEQHLAEQPDDARGWEVLANIYARLNRAGDAAKAYRQLIRLNGPQPDLLTAYAQSLVYANDGKVTEDALEAAQKAVAADPDNAQAHFFIGMAAEQRGDKDAAIATYSKIVSEAPPGAPWVNMVRERIASLGGTPPAARSGPQSEQGSAIAAQSPEEQQKTIRSMVDGLAARLAANGGGVEEWSRLVRAYTVLREPEKARTALADARKALGSDAGAMAALDALARELGLGG